MTPEGFKPAIPASDRQQTVAFDSSVTGMGPVNSVTILIIEGYK
jgi:hypothetical protein